LKEPEALQSGLRIGDSVAQARAVSWHFAPVKNSVVAALVGLPKAGMLLSDAPPRPMQAQCRLAKGKGFRLSEH